jgi:hypothetical protein
VTQEALVQRQDAEAVLLQNRLTNELLQANQQIQGVEPGTRHPGEGPVFRRIKEQIAENARQLTQARGELENLRAGERDELIRLDREYADRAVPHADDLLSRYVALGSLKQNPKKGGDAWAMAWGVRLLLIMLELTPALIKILQEENEYDAVVQANRRRSIARVYAIANDHMEQLAQNGGQNPAPTLIEQLKADPLTS